MEQARAYQYWMALKKREDAITYRFFPMVLNEQDHTFTIAREQVIETTVAAMVENGAELLIQTNSIKVLKNLRVLYNAQGVTAGVS